LGVQDTTADITSVTYLTFANGSSSSGPVAINQMTIAGAPVSPERTMLLIGFAGLGLMAFRRKSKPALIGKNERQQFHLRNRTQWSSA
jgi:hypothetical protein